MHLKKLRISLSRLKIVRTGWIDRDGICGSGEIIQFLALRLLYHKQGRATQKFVAILARLLNVEKVFLETKFSRFPPPPG